MFTRWRLPPESVGHLVVGAVAQVGQLEHPVHGVASGSAHPLEPGEQAQVLGHGELPVERRLLGHPADLRRGLRHAALVGPLDPGEDREQRGLAGAVGADHRHQLAAAGGQRHAAAAPRGRRSA